MPTATHRAIDLGLTAGSSAVAGAGYLFAQVVPDAPVASWACVAVSVVGFLSLSVKSLFEYLGKKLDHGEALAELRALRAEVTVYRARLGVHLPAPDAPLEIRA